MKEEIKFLGFILLLIIIYAIVMGVCFAAIAGDVHKGHPYTIENRSVTIIEKQIVSTDYRFTRVYGYIVIASGEKLWVDNGSVLSDMRVPANYTITIEGNWSVMDRVEPRIIDIVKEGDHHR